MWEVGLTWTERFLWAGIGCGAGVAIGVYFSWKLFRVEVYLLGKAIRKDQELINQLNKELLLKEV